jgi:hypothetical protein
MRKDEGGSLAAQAGRGELRVLATWLSGISQTDTVIAKKLYKFGRVGVYW